MTYTSWPILKFGHATASLVGEQTVSLRPPEHLGCGTQEDGLLRRTICAARYLWRYGWSAVPSALRAGFAMVTLGQRPLGADGRERGEHVTSTMIDSYVSATLRASDGLTESQPTYAGTW